MKILSLLIVCIAAIGGDLQAQSPATPVMMTVDARIVLLDRERSNRVGLRWLQVGEGRVRVQPGRGGIRVSKDLGDLTVSAFVDLAREEGVVQSDSRLQVSTLSGSPARVATGALAVGPRGTRETGPELLVTPTLLTDGSIRVEVRARTRDLATGRYGTPIDASPVDAVTTVVVRPGVTATLANISSSTERQDTGILRWESGSRRVDALVELKVGVQP